MTPWIKDRLPTPEDADPLGMVRWGPALPGYICRWQDVRLGEPWTHTSAWTAPSAGRS
jgi:hypothetical protein